MTLYASRTLLALLFVAPNTLHLQSDPNRFKGFTEAHPEHIIVELQQPIVVRDVRGEIRDTGGYFKEGVIFEIRLHLSSLIRGTKTDEKGRFNIRHAPAGTYDFKATMDGFQSVVGTIVVTPKADPKTKINLTLSFGV